MSENTILDLDSLLDSNLGNVEDVPDFVNPPAGTYNLRIKEAKSEQYERKAKDGKPAQKGLRLRVMFEVVNTIECKEMHVPDGAMFSLSYMATEEGLKYFKKDVKGFMNVKDLGDATVRDLLDALASTEFPAAITVRKTGDYENLNVRAMYTTDPT